MKLQVNSYLKMLFTNTLHQNVKKGTYVVILTK